MAVVVAESRYQAVDAAEAVEVEYQTLPAAVDPQEARLPEAPLVHADVPGNRTGSVHIEVGDTGAAFEMAPVVVRRTLSVARSACAAVETRCALAEPRGPDGESGLTVYTSTQAPHSHRAALAGIFGLPFDRVRVLTPDVGGGFGPKGRLYPEEVVVAALALQLGSPVSWQADRSEDFLTTYQGRGATVEAELASDTAGRLLALRVRIIQDCGAFLATGLMVPANSAQHVIGPYRLPAAQIDIEGVYTNKTPLSPLRGGGREVGVFVIERMMDHLAAELNLDPSVVRERNALGPDEFPHDTGFPSRSGATVVYDSGDFPGHLRRAKQLIDYDRRRAGPAPTGRRRRGVAITLFIESTGFAGETAKAELRSDGTIRLAVGSPSNGQGHATTMAQLCASKLGVPIETVEYHSGDTAAVEEGVGTFGSRMAVTAGNASALAGAALRRRILEAAEDILEASAVDLEIVDGGVRVKGYPERSLSLGRVASEHNSRAGGGEVEPLAVTTPFASRGAFAGGAHAAVVEVDLDTGAIRVEKYVVVHDCGTVINPVIVDGQVHGGVAHGIGNALGERMDYDGQGQLLTGAFSSYGISFIDGVPSVEVIHDGVPSPNNPEGIKGAGEGGTIGALATIARAVEDALEPFGIEINHLPIDPAQIAIACRT